MTDKKIDFFKAREERIKEIKKIKENRVLVMCRRCNRLFNDNKLSCFWCMEPNSKLNIVIQGGKK